MFAPRSKLRSRPNKKAHHALPGGLSRVVRRGRDFGSLRSPIAPRGSRKIYIYEVPTLTSFANWHFIPESVRKHASSRSRSKCRASCACGTSGKNRRYCGGGGIRTLDTHTGILVFETSAFSQALPPLQCTPVLWCPGDLATAPKYSGR